jgi:type IV pilus assembly protein PilP
MCLLSFLIASCSRSNQDLIRYIKEIKQRKTGDIMPSPTYPSLASFKFPDKGKRRSPFIPTKLRPKEPLEVFPLDSLKFVGVLKQGDKVWALIKKPNKEITWVKVGNYMGPNQGRILSIRDDLMQLIETTKSLGKWKRHKIIIELYTGK